MGKVILSGVSKGMTPPTTYESNFADNTWEQIIDACQKNAVPDTWLVADQKTMTINGIDYQIDIIGKNHDTYSDGSGTAPLTFQMHNCFELSYCMNSTNTNLGGWKDSYMRGTVLPQVLSVMPIEVQAGIKEVNKITSTGYCSTTLGTVSDKLFLLSEVEMFGTIGYAVLGEGTKYEYYLAGNDSPKFYGVGDNGSVVHWLRSPRGDNATQYVACGFSNNKNAAQAVNAGNSQYIAPAFCF